MGDMQLKPELVQELCAFARERKIQKLMLFGSRARGDNRPKSDIDLAVQGGDVAGFTDDVNEKARTLLLEYGYRPGEAAQAVGYADIFSFSRMFKRRYGVSPSALRR